jgi:TolA-binding protein
MSKTDDGRPGERERSPVERLAAGVVGSDAMKSATKRALEARERAVELQEFTLGALNLPSAAVIDRLTRRVRSVALRLESIEDGLDRLEDRLDDASGGGQDLDKVLARLEAIEQRIEQLQSAPAPAAKPAAARKAAAKAAKTPARKAAASKAAPSKAPAAKAAPKSSDGSR